MTGQVVFLNYRRLLRESIEAFRSARQQDYKVTLISKNLPPALANEVDNFIEANISEQSEMERISDILIGQNISAVVCFTETAIEAAAWLNAKLGLCGLPPSAVLASRNKSEMRKRTAQVGPVKSIVVNSEEDVLSFFYELGQKIILKPINSSGSQGIFTIKSEEDINIWKSNYFNVAAPKYDLTKEYKELKYVAEQFIDGVEYSIEGYVFDEKVTIVGITAKQVSEEYKLELRHVFPAKLSIAEKNEIENQTNRIIGALGLNNTSFHLEGKLDGKMFHMIEVAARPAGDYIASHLISYASNYDFYGNLINVSLGIPPIKIGPTRAISGIQFIIAEKEGIFAGIDGLEEVLMSPLVRQIMIEVPFGTQILLPPNNFRLQRLVAVISSASSHEELNEHFEHVKTILKPKFE